MPGLPAQYIADRNAGNRVANVVRKTETATITIAEFLKGKVFATHASAAIALTLPTACEALLGAVCEFHMKGAAAVTIIDADGYGAGSSATITLTIGLRCQISCELDDDGGYSYSYINTTAAA